MVSKKHYKAIAAIIKEQHIDCSNAKDYPVTGNADTDFAIINCCCDIACELAKYFENDNPEFNREKFLIACGIEI